MEGNREIYNDDCTPQNIYNVFEPLELGKGVAFSNGDFKFKQSIFHSGVLTEEVARTDPGKKLSTVDINTSGNSIDMVKIVQSEELADNSFSFGLDAKIPLHGVFLSALLSIKHSHVKHSKKELLVYMAGNIVAASELEGKSLENLVFSQGENKDELNNDYVTRNVSGKIQDSEDFVDAYGTHFVSGNYYGYAVTIASFLEEDSDRKDTKTIANLKAEIEIEKLKEALKAKKEGNVKDVSSDEGGAGQPVICPNEDSTVTVDMGINVSNKKISSKRVSSVTFNTYGINIPESQKTWIEQGKDPETVVARARVVINNITATGKPGVKKMQQNIVGAICSPYTRYLPNLKLQKIIWETESENQSEFALVGGSLQGKGHYMPSDHPRIIAKFKHTLKGEENIYALGFTLSGDSCISFVSRQDYMRTSNKHKVYLHDNSSEDKKSITRFNLLPEAVGLKLPTSVITFSVGYQPRFHKQFLAKFENTGEMKTRKFKEHDGCVVHCHLDHVDSLSNNNNEVNKQSGESREETKNIVSEENEKEMTMLGLLSKSRSQIGYSAHEIGMSSEGTEEMLKQAAILSQEAEKQRGHAKKHPFNREKREEIIKEAGKLEEEAEKLKKAANKDAQKAAEAKQKGSDDNNNNNDDDDDVSRSRRNT